MSKHSAACCTIPPVVAENYTPKGDYVKINGLKTYVTGPKDATTAILSIYDIFGYGPQTIQGADILASTGYQVYVPDFFEGSPAEFSWYPPDTPEKQGKLGPWFEKNAPPVHLPRVQGIVDDATKHNSKIEKWGMIGYCWGGKMVSLISGRDTVFKVGVQTSPAMVDPSDAEKTKIPMCMLASKDEEEKDVKAYEEKLKGTKHVEIFEKMGHGFMSTRADFKDSEQKSEYERGYQIALTFIQDNL